MNYVKINWKMCDIFKSVVSLLITLKALHNSDVFSRFFNWVSNRAPYLRPHRAKMIFKDCMPVEDLCVFKILHIL